jgi:hypothetical protein
MKRLVQTSRLLALLLVACSALVAHAQHATPAAAGEALKQFATERQLPFHERVLPNGEKRVVVNVTKQDDLNKLSQLTGRGQNVLQIVHINKPGLMHTMAMFDGELIHLQTPTNFRTWQLNQWGYNLRESSSQTYSAMIHLTPGEATNLRGRIKTARAQMQTTPDNTMTDAFGTRGMNCASGWCGLPLGEHNEPLWQLTGLRGDNGHPWSFEQELERTSSNRVFGLAIFGPKIEGFEKKAGEQLFQFR